ncbi:hypothetical protein GRI34_11470 [Erythrobacter aquimaris]|uniref:Uncharacterized protein n=1 Tax=Qipengyuania aquimaris TaxID=255984 RepID=A0A6I4TM07_9SPHN|nr:hypothetical protein [Qipengyuania aquimaris]MXO97035.1 hypothetical protein [Qipengyuania aquimaris]
MSRLGGAGVCILLIASSHSAFAQDGLEAQSATPPERIDILIREEVDEEDEQRLEDCSEEQDAAEISREIIVCRRRNTENAKYYDKDETERRIAARSQGQKPVDTFGIPNHGFVAARGCFIGPCPPPMPVLIDVRALPEAPPGSDADRVARGLAPRGNDGLVAPGPSEAEVVHSAGMQENADQLALPKPDLRDDEEVSPSGSASPEEQPSG